MASFYDTKFGATYLSVDRNDYDVVSVDWHVPPLELWEKVQMDIPLRLRADTEIGLYAYWQSVARDESETGSTHMRDNAVNAGFGLSVPAREQPAPDGFVLVEAGSFKMGGGVRWYPKTGQVVRIVDNL